MGAKTWMIVSSDNQSSSKFKSYPKPNLEKTVALLNRLFPNEKLEKTDDGDLSSTCPPNDMIYAGYFEGISVVAAKEFGIDNPSKLDRRFISESPFSNTYLHAMHSVVDWFAFAKWEDGELKRSLSLSPDSGILEDIGERIEFEIPYWNGGHPAVDSDEDDEEEYPFEFHPLELGEAVLKAFFGYQLEGFVDDELIEPERITLFGFKRAKPWWKIW
ncbi:hypothetical protein GCM10008090_27640 [Arenicella chitinivorans]|uniref:Uncharacterized protein n=1 Tax=Arenicella chitinivorans TaxID=1329800 RepID=A0A918VRG5_9GAMM|nr:hypothetical protein [Arenicella chitinivorans]GHA16307.1 hypothetical protein GCM10008090_27640 [Arenicella chitinivorans]